MARTGTSRRLYDRRRLRRYLAEEPTAPEEPIASVETDDDDTVFDIPIALEENEDDDFNPDFNLEAVTVNDLDALADQIDLHDNRITPLPPDFNLQELQLTDQYDDNIAATIEVDATLQALPTQPFDESPATETIPTTPSTVTVATDDEDDSEIVEHLRTKTTDPSHFHTTLGLWCQEAGISRPQYASLLEILRMADLQKEVHKLPSCLSSIYS
jgi:hypothetical protein